MEGRKFDFIIFGATGFTGQYTVDEVARVAEEENLTWAVAGRSSQKLRDVLKEASARTGKNLGETPIIIADTSDPSSLIEMAKQGKVVLNCVGPYRFYGEPVVNASIEAGAHHLDISGEPDFLGKMQLQFSAKARANNVFVIGATGFDSIPAEMGLLYTRKQFSDGKLTNVESYLTVHSGSEGLTLNTGTFESAVYAMAHITELKSLNKALFPEPLPEFDYTLPKRRPVFYSKDMNKWVVPFPGSDQAVVNRTMQSLLGTGRLEKPVEFNPYFCLASFAQVLGLFLFAVVIGIMANISFLRSLLLKYPHIFTLGLFKKGGPTKKQMETCGFSMTFIGHGYDKIVANRTDKTPNKIVITKVAGPELAYVTTPICMVQAGVTLLKEQDKIPHKGGVLTPGSVFWDTSLIDRLQKHNIKFTTLSSNTTSK